MEQMRWLPPTLLGPLAGMTGLVTTIVVANDAFRGDRLRAWSVLMVFAALFAGIQATVLVLLDLALAAMRLRRLPSGMRGWGTAMMAPVLALMAILAALLGLFEHHPWAACFGGAAMAAIPIRLLLGPKWRSE
jgi:hypothetical protein